MTGISSGTLRSAIEYGLPLPDDSLPGRCLGHGRRYRTPRSSQTDEAESSEGRHHCSSLATCVYQIDTVLAARGRIAADPLRMMLRISTAQVLPSPRKCPFPWGPGPPPNIWFLGPHESTLHTTNGISIGSAMFAQLMFVTNRQTHSHTDRPRYRCNTRAFEFAIRIDSIRYASRFGSIRLVKKSAFRFTSCHAVFWTK